MLHRLLGGSDSHFCNMAVPEHMVNFFKAMQHIDTQEQVHHYMNMGVFREFEFNKNGKLGFYFTSVAFSS